MVKAILCTFHHPLTLPQPDPNCVLHSEPFPPKHPCFFNAHQLGVWGGGGGIPIQLLLHKGAGDLSTPHLHPPRLPIAHGRCRFDTFHPVLRLTPDPASGGKGLLSLGSRSERGRLQRAVRPTNPSSSTAQFHCHSRPPPAPRPMSAERGRVLALEAPGGRQAGGFLSDPPKM